LKQRGKDAFKRIFKHLQRKKNEQKGPKIWVNSIAFFLSSFLNCVFDVLSKNYNIVWCGSQCVGKIFKEMATEHPKKEVRLLYFIQNGKMLTSVHCEKLYVCNIYDIILKQLPKSVQRDT
jgi:hypothetical protein